MEWSGKGLHILYLYFVLINTCFQSLGNVINKSEDEGEHADDHISQLDNEVLESIDTSADKNIHILLDALNENKTDMSNNTCISHELKENYNKLAWKVDNMIHVAENTNAMLKALKQTMATMISYEIKDALHNGVPTVYTSDDNELADLMNNVENEDEESESGNDEGIDVSTTFESDDGSGEAVDMTGWGDNNITHNSSSNNGSLAGYDKQAKSTCRGQELNYLEPTTVVESAEACSEVCNNHSSCVAFVYKPNDETENCQPTDYCETTGYSNDTDVYRKQEDIYNVPGFTVTKDHNCFGEDWLEKLAVDSIATCAHICRQYGGDCLVFTYDTRKRSYNCDPRDEHCNTIPEKGVHTYKLDRVHEYDEKLRKRLCKKGLDSFKLRNKYYKIYKAKRTWHGAERFCQDFWCHKAHLAEVTSKEEHIFLQAIMSIHRVRYPNYYATNSFWTGGKLMVVEGDGFNATNRQYNWVKGKQKVGDYWADGEPNDWTNDDQKCVKYVHSENTGFQLYDDSCFSYNGFVCEVQLP